MQTWTKLVIDVDYSPSDPGINNWFCERTTYERADLHDGQRLHYDDPGGLFGAISVDKVSEEGVTLHYGGSTYTLTVQGSGLRLDQDGRDYTNFYLGVYLEKVPDNEEKKE